MLCLQLFVHRGTLGALDLLARETSAFTDEYEHVGLLLASLPPSRRRTPSTWRT